MEFTQLSLAGGVYADGKNGAGAGESMKRKWKEESHDVDLQFKHPLPSDWEQCLDLQSGKMYYVNRKTSKKSWLRPEEQTLDLELNISSGHNTTKRGEKEEEEESSNMVALACSNCHLLVILSRSSPSCPNCKYVHSLASSSLKPNNAPAPNWPF